MVNRIAILSDIHSNYEAFQACVDDMQDKAIDYVVFLGDYISDYAFPEKTMDLLYQVLAQYPSIAILGNREEYFIHPDKTWRPSSQTGSLYYTYHHLRPEDFAFIRALPKTAVLRFKNRPKILLAHGSPANTRELLLREKNNTHRWLDSIQEKVLVCGHTHVPMIECWHNKMIMNPGSIGENVCGQTDATYGLLVWENHQWQPSIQHVKYDYRKEQQRMLDSDLPETALYWAAATYKNLGTGRNEALLMLKRAKRSTANEMISEEDFARAASKLDIHLLR